MAYNKTVWENLPSTSSPINADNLNHIEEGIYQNSLNIESVIPTGTINAFAGNNTPQGWLICDGSEISRITYATLFNIIGTTYGNGDGTTTFNIPNLKGKVIVGVDSQDTDFDTLGETGGSKYMQGHKHSAVWSVTGTGNKGQAYDNMAFVRAGNQTADSQLMWTGYRSGSGTQNGIKDLSDNQIEVGDSGNLQPYTVVNYIIKY